ncbi:MAG TPA: beta-ketoacyl synthase N-terminal-like domain-containing protein [Tepidisphaeraceae bacterium]|nr:beta-ketoacyl synthase N-terminal-like domain-containing protein [Tepidisphaeraceae bacterium]
MSIVPVISGIGLATPLGDNLAATWDGLCAGRHITDHARVPGINAGSEPRVNMLARRVAHEAVASAGWSHEQRETAALVVGTSKGPVEAWIGPPPKYDFETTFAPVGRRRVFGLADTADAITADLRLGFGPRLTLSAACASGLHALIRAAIMLRSGEADRAIVVAAESSLHPLFLHSFRRLGVIPPEGVGCRPFDERRAGFLLSEAAAAVCLELPETARARPWAAVDRFAMGADATHLTGSDPAGGLLRRLLAQVIDSRPIDLVHAHGTGTIANDPIELAAIDSVMTGQTPAPSLYSHKGALGHSLGAAGLVAVAINCLAHRHGVVPPNVRTTTPLPSRHVRIHREIETRPVRRSLISAAGFGGPTAVVSLGGV